MPLKPLAHPAFIGVGAPKSARQSQRQRSRPGAENRTGGRRRSGGNRDCAQSPSVRRPTTSRDRPYSTLRDSTDQAEMSKTSPPVPQPPPEPSPARDRL